MSTETTEKLEKVKVLLSDRLHVFLFSLLSVKKKANLSMKYK